MSRLSEQEQEAFNRCLDQVSPEERRVLQQCLQGKSSKEIAKITHKKVGTDRKKVRTIDTHLSHIYDKFNSLLKERNRDELIELFCKFKRELVSHKLLDKLDRLRVDDYLNMGDIRSDDSNFLLLEGIEYLYQKDYEKAIMVFEKEIDYDPSKPIARILLNNARAYQQERKRPLRIAVVVSYSPQNNSHVDATENVLRGIADAQTQFNESGGKDGRWLEVIIADDRNQPEVAKKQAKNLSEVEDILAIIGHHSSEGTAEALQVYRDSSIAVISPASTSSKLKDETFFRTIGSTKAVAKAYIQYISDYLKLDKVAIFYHSGNEYSQTLKEDVQEACAGKGIITPIFINMRNTSLGVEDEIAEIRDKNFQAALVLSSIETNKVALDIIRTNFRYASQKLELILSTSFPENLILERGGDFVKEVIFVRPDLTEESNYIAQAKERWDQEEVNWRVATSYAAMQAVIEAIRLSNKDKAIRKENLITRKEILSNLQAIARSGSQASRFRLNWSALDDPANSEREYRLCCMIQGQF